ncbi:MAG: winged helix-turn-helix domain-containing protein [Elusimicrobiota bacterium]
MLIKLKCSIKKQISILKKWLNKSKQNNNLRLWLRIKSIMLYLNNKSPNEIVDTLDVGQKSVYRWIADYNKSGIEGLFEGKHTGRPAGLNQEQLRQLADIIDSGPVAYGFETGVWTSKIIREVIKEEFGVIYHDGHVRKILYKLGFSVQDPRKKLALADKNLQQKWIRETYPTLKKTSKSKRNTYVSR